MKERILKGYYSIYFDDGDPNFPSEIRVCGPHENNMGFTKSDIEKLGGNYFASKRDAIKARKTILEALNMRESK